MKLLELKIMLYQDRACSYYTISINFKKETLYINYTAKFIISIQRTWNIYVAS